MTQISAELKKEGDIPVRRCVNVAGWKTRPPLDQRLSVFIRLCRLWPVL